MKNPFPRITCGVLNDHVDQLGGGTVHAFKFLEYLKLYYDCDVYMPKDPKSKKWMREFLHLDTEGLRFFKYEKGAEDKYKYLFLNISHWRIAASKAKKRWALVFFPQFYFPTHDFNFLANSKYTKENIKKKWKIPAKKIKVVYPPIMVSQFNPLKKTNSIIHVSRFSGPVPEADKGHRQMIETFKKMVDGGLKGWTLDMVGQIQDPKYYDALQAIAKGYPIVFHAGAAFSTLQELYGKAKIYWHMTGVTMPKELGAQEHFGMTIVEAMASGAVPISLNSGGPKEIIKDGKNGFLVVDTSGLAKKTELLIKDDALLKKMSKGAIKRSGLFDEEKTKEKFYSVLTRTDKVSIIILCYNNLHLTKKCVERLYEVTPPGFELILVDNASTDVTKQYFKEVREKYPNVKCVFNRENYGFSKGNNKGLKKATREYVCYLNNDTEPQWGWLERMVDVLEGNEEAGVVGARLYFPQEGARPWKIQHAGISFNSMGVPHQDGSRQADDLVPGVGVQEVEAVTGAALLVRKELAKFDEVYERGYYEDDDLCLRAREKGYRVYINHEARLIHHEGATQHLSKVKDEAKHNAISRQNKETFIKVWKDRMRELPPIRKEIDISGTGAPLKIEIGGGENPLYPDWVQVDLRKLPNVKYQKDARALPFASNSLINICSSHLLQCLTRPQAELALAEWFRCLKPGGQLEIHVPDLDQLFRHYLSQRDLDTEIMQETYGKQEYELDYYHWGYSFQTLDIILSKVGFVRVTKINPTSNHKFNLAVLAFKPGQK